MEITAINRVSYGHRRRPVDRIEDLADAFGISGDERFAFIEQAHLAVVADFVMNLISVLRDDLRYCRAQKDLLGVRLRMRRAGAN